MQSISQPLLPPTGLIKNNSFIESIFVIGIFFGIILMGSKFTHIGFERLYIVEYLIILLNISLTIKIVQDGSIRRDIYRLARSELIFLVGLLILGSTTLALCLDNGFLALRQSLITLYASIVFIYIYSFNSEKSLLKFLYLLLVFFSFFNCIKIFTYLYMGLTHEDEPYRVKHEEMDAIFSAIALLGLFAYRNTLFRSQKLLCIVLTLLNLAVLFLTIKRTAFIGLFIGSAFIIYQDSIHKTIKKKHVLIAAIAIFSVSIITSFIFREQIHNTTQILVKKISVLSENNTVWRIQAWKIAVADISNNPVLGNGYGHRILKESLKGVDTMDPHNSYLAITAYNGLLGLFLLLSMLVISFRKYLSLLHSTSVPEERNTLLFFTAGFIFMVVYAFFNVTLEVQRLAVFFWFFVAGSFLLDRLRKIPLQEATSAQTISLHTIVLTAGIAIYLLSLGISENYIKRIDIYLPANQGQYPEIKSPGIKSTEIKNPSTDVTTIQKQKNQFTITLPPRQSESYTELQWIIPNDIYAIKGRENDYYAVFEVAGDTVGIGVQFRAFDGNPINAESIFPNSNRIVVPLSVLANQDLKRIYGIALIVPHGSEPRVLTFHRVAIETMELREKYSLFSPGDVNQYPHLQTKDVSPELDIGDNHIAIHTPATEKITYASLNWQLPTFINEEYFGKDKFLEFSFNTASATTDNFIQISNSKGYTTLENITPNSKKITVDLGQIDNDFLSHKDRPSTLSLHIKYGAAARQIDIRRIEFLNKPGFFNEIAIFSGANHGDLYPYFYAENNNSGLSKSATKEELLISSKKSISGWSSIYWPFPKIGLSAPSLSTYSLILDFGTTKELPPLHFGFTINGEYIAADDYKFIAKNRLQVSTRAIERKLFQASLLSNEVGFNISTPTEPHEISFSIKSISLVKKDNR